MKKIFQCLGTAVASTVCGYLLWLLFYWLTPYIMGVGWFLFFVYLFFAGGLLTGIIGSLSTILAIPVAYLTSNNTVAKIINAIPLLVFGYCSVCLPWGLNMEYKLLQYIIAISLSATYLITFVSLLICPFSIDDEKLQEKKGA